MQSQERVKRPVLVWRLMLPTADARPAKLRPAGAHTARDLYLSKAPFARPFSRLISTTGGLACSLPPIAISILAAAGGAPIISQIVKPVHVPACPC
jgi:hypothetical protein